jgi:hypothetical protein
MGLTRVPSNMLAVPPSSSFPASAEAERFSEMQSRSKAIGENPKNNVVFKSLDLSNSKEKPAKQVSAQKVGHRGKTNIYEAKVKSHFRAISSPYEGCKISREEKIDFELTPTQRFKSKIGLVPSASNVKIASQNDQVADWTSHVHYAELNVD